MSEFIVVGLCILFNAILASAEMAFVTIRKSLLREAAKKGSSAAAYLLRLRDNPERTLSIVQVGITLVGAIAAAVGGAGAEEALSPYFAEKFNLSENTAEAIAICVVVVPLTYVSVVIGELVPKSLALRNPLFIAIMGSYLFRFFDRVLSPVITVLEWSTRLVLRLFFWRGRSSDLPVEVESNLELDSLSNVQRQYVLNVVDLGKKSLQSIMVPWDQVIKIERSQTFAEVDSIFISSGHTRLPVVVKGEPTGILNSKEFMALKSAGGTDWQSIARAPISLQRKTPLLHALRLLQEHNIRMLFVLNEQHIVGMVTFEDIIQEVIGEIYDENDEGTIKRILSAGAKRQAAR